MPSNFLSNFPGTLPGPPRDQVLHRFALLMLPLWVVLGLATWLVLHLHVELETDALYATERARLELAVRLLGYNFDTISSDLMTLADATYLQRLLDAPADEPRRRQVEQEFLALSRNKAIYDQVRYLNADGEEVVRVNFHQGRVYAVPQARRQNKAHRYYFADTLGLGRGEIYVSPLDLNIEHGSLEQPFKPMIRFGTPVFDSAGTKRGVVVLNYLAAELLRRFREATTGGPGEPMLLNAQGYWLSAPEPADEWGFMLEHQHSFAERYGREWKVIVEGGEGRLESDHGLFLFRRVSPLSPRQRTSSGSARATGASAEALSGAAYSWILVIRVPPAHLPGINRVVQPATAGLSLAVLLVLGLGCWQLAYAWAARRQWQQALMESESRFRAVFREAGIGIALVGTDGRLVQTNPALQRLVGHPEQVLAGRLLEGLVHPDHLRRARALFNETVHGLRDSYAVELDLLTGGGETRNARCFVSLLRSDRDAPGRALVLVEDLSRDRLAVETEQRLQDQLTHMARISVMGELMVILAHEISTPLGAIVNFAGGSIRRIQGGQVQPEALLEPLKRISSQAKLAGEIIQRVRGFVRKEQGSGGAVALAEVVADVTLLLERSLRRHGTEVDTRVTATLPLAAVPKVQLEQVLLNLLLNGAEVMQAIPEGARHMKLEAGLDPQGWLEVHVCDSGPPLSDADLDRLFEPFYTTKSGGLGMGLAICRTIVESWGGRIRAVPRAGGGLCFEFTVPTTTRS